jgi:hypothetical protein
MATKISRSGYIGIIVLLVMLLIVLLFTADNYNSILFSDFIYSCKVCAAVITVSGIILINLQNNMFTIANTSYAFFVMFQFGSQWMDISGIDYLHMYGLFVEFIVTFSFAVVLIEIICWISRLVNKSPALSYFLFSRIAIIS